jgi:hypothetical protein
MRMSVAQFSGLTLDISGLDARGIPTRRGFPQEISNPRTGIEREIS